MPSFGMVSGGGVVYSCCGGAETGAFAAHEVLKVVSVSAGGLAAWAEDEQVKARTYFFCRTRQRRVLKLTKKYSIKAGSRFGSKWVGLAYSGASFGS